MIKSLRIFSTLNNIFKILICLDDEDDENEDSFELGDVDDDHLFEFDMSPSGEIDDGENETEEEDDEITKIASDPPQERRRAYSVTSDSSGGSCSHRKLVEPEENFRSGFCMFGSTSSGLGSDRRALSQVSLFFLMFFIRFQIIQGGL